MSLYTYQSVVNCITLALFLSVVTTNYVCSWSKIWFCEWFRWWRLERRRELCAGLLLEDYFDQVHPSISYKCRLTRILWSHSLNLHVEYEMKTWKWKFYTMRSWLLIITSQMIPQTMLNGQKVGTWLHSLRISVYRLSWVTYRKITLTPKSTLSLGA